MSLSVQKAAGRIILPFGDGEPALSDGEPVLSDGEPVLSDGEPVLSDGESVLSDGESVLSDGEPALSDEEPVLFESHASDMPSPSHFQSLRSPMREGSLYSYPHLSPGDASHQVGPHQGPWQAATLCRGQ